DGGGAEQSEAEGVPAPQSHHPHNNSNHQSPLPLDTDELLAHYLDPSCDLLDLAVQFDLTIDQLIAWADHPATRARIDALNRIADRRARDVAIQNTPEALQQLANLATSCLADQRPLSAPLEIHTRETTRKAATFLIRAASVPSRTFRPSRQPVPRPAAHPDPARHHRRPARTQSRAHRVAESGSPTPLLAPQHTERSPSPYRNHTPRNSMTVPEPTPLTPNSRSPPH
ncbi:MAG: hypothetical protein IH985_10375, partial [Planctomycetes bacterium]|nr:hypothetical protein [Planctomycetota bacterium]